jgi:hypothetical protein
LGDYPVNDRFSLTYRRESEQLVFESIECLAYSAEQAAIVRQIFGPSRNGKF